MVCGRAELHQLCADSFQRQLRSGGEGLAATTDPLHDDVIDSALDNCPLQGLVDILIIRGYGEHLDGYLVVATGKATVTDNAS
jgi:hypothetical protein